MSKWEDKFFNSPLAFITLPALIGLVGLLALAVDNKSHGQVQKIEHRKEK